MYIYIYIYIYICINLKIYIPQYNDIVFKMEYLSVFYKRSSILILKIMSFNGDYVNFGCNKEMSIKIYIHHKVTSFSK